jgi:hypothetical protein
VEVWVAMITASGRASSIISWWGEGLNGGVLIQD